jgi:hypothetical protein
MDAGDINKYTQQHKGEDQETYDEGLKNLSYDLLYGDKYATNGENPYKATDIKLGLNEVKLSSVTPLYDEEGTVYLYGNNFTTYSKVYINEEKQATEYIDPNTLMIVYPELKAGDEISVYQQNSDDHVLTQTELFAFNDDELQPQTKSKKKIKRNNKK